MRRRAIVAALAVLVAAGVARGDGDPASDVLYASDVFVTYSKPSAASTAALISAVAKANASGYRLKVAVVASRQDLGTIPSLFGKPSQYARFLGSELRFFFHGHLLVTMPGGFGVYFDGHATTTPDRLLRGVKMAGRDPDSLVAAAASAASTLVAKDKSKRRYKDVYPPNASAIPATAKRGEDAKLQYAVYDDSLKARTLVVVFSAENKVLASHAVPLGPAFGMVGTFTWPVPADLGGTPHFCVTGTDAAGNKSKRSCAGITLG